MNLVIHKMKKTIFLLPIVFMLHSCLYLHEKYVSTLSEIKYGDDTEAITSAGFYTLLDSSFNKEKGVNSYNIMFYPDQTVCFFHIYKDSLKSYDTNINFEKCIPKWGREKNKWGVQWGVYTKRNDSIYTDMYDLMGPFYPPVLNICKDFFLLRNDTLLHKRPRGGALKAKGLMIKSGTTSMFTCRQIPYRSRQTIS